MYAISNDYKEIIYSGDARHRLKLYFNGVDFDTILGMEADRVCEKLIVRPRIIPNGGTNFTLDNFMSTEAELILHDIDLEDVAEPISISIGTLVNNDYEYVPIGIFNISDKPTTDKNKTTFKLYDNAIKFDFNYNGKDLMDSSETGKVTKLQVLQDICSQAGVQTEINTFIGSTDELTTYDNTITARQYISFLAEQSGAIPKIDRTGKLIFVYLNNLQTVRIPLSIVEKYEIGKPYEIGRVVYEDGVRKFSEPLNEVQNKDNLFINASNPYIFSQGQVSSIYGLVNGFKIDSLKTGKILGDPAIDPYDLIEIYNDYVQEETIIAKTLATYTMTYNGKIINTYDTEIGEESRTENMSLKQAGTGALKRYVRSEINEIDASITLLTGEVHGEDGQGGLVGDTNELRIDMYGTTGRVQNIIGDVTNLQLRADGLELDVKKSGNNLLMGTELYDDSQWGLGVYNRIYEGDTMPDPNEYEYWYNTETQVVWERVLVEDEHGVHWQYITTDLKRKDIREQNKIIDGITIIENEFTNNNFLSKRAMNVTDTTIKPTIIDNTQDYLTFSCKLQNSLTSGHFTLQLYEQSYLMPTENEYGAFSLVYSKEINVGEYEDLSDFSFTIPIIKEKDRLTGKASLTAPVDDTEYWLDLNEQTYGLYHKEDNQWVAVSDIKLFYASNTDTWYIPFINNDIVYYVNISGYSYEDYNAKSIYGIIRTGGDTFPDPATGTFLIGDIKLEYGETATEWSNNMNEIYGRNYKMDNYGFEIKQGDYTLHLDEDEATGYYKGVKSFQLSQYNVYSKRGVFEETDQNGLVTKKLSNGIYVRYIK